MMLLAATVARSEWKGSNPLLSMPMAEEAA